MKITAAVMLSCVLFLSAVATAAPTTQPAATTQPARTDRANLPLAEVMPGLDLPDPRTGRDLDLPPQARDLVDEAEKLLAEKRGVLAIVRLEKALSYSPKSRQIHLALGRAHVQTGNAAKAELHLARALSFGSDDQQAWYWLAVAQRDLKREPEALKSLLLANKATPAPADSPIAVLLPYDLGRSLDSQGYSAAALPLLEQSLAAINSGKLSDAQKGEPRIAELIRTGQATLAADVARLKVATGQASDAIADLEKLVASGKADHSTYVALVQAYIDQKELTKAGDTLANLARNVVPANASAVASELLSKSVKPRVIADIAAARLFGSEKSPRKPTVAESSLAIMNALAMERVRKGEGAKSLMKFVAEVPAAHPLVYVMLIESAGKSQAGVEAVEAAVRNHPADPAVLKAADRFLASQSVEQARAAADAMANRGGLGFAEMYVAGRLRIAASQPDKAIDLLAQSARQRPAFAPAYVERMKLHAAAGDFDKVLAVRDEAGKAGIKDATVYHLAGQAWIKRAGPSSAPDAVAKALDELRSAEQLDRENVAIVLDLADAYMADGQTASALRRLRRLYEQDSRNLEVLLRLARANEAMANYDEALIYANAAQKIDPKNNDANRIRGMSLLQDGKTREAIPILQVVARQNPNDARCQAALGQALVAGARWKEAIEPLQKALALDAANVAARRALADAFAKTGRLDEAVEQWKLLVDKAPNDMEIVGSLMAELIRRGELKDAAELLEKLPSARDVFADELARQAIMKRDFDLAQKVIARQIELVGNDETARRRWQMRMIDLLLAQNKRDEAVAMAGQFHEKFPKDDEITGIYVSALILAKRNDEAIKVAKAAYDDDADSEEIAQIYFMALTAAKQYDQAIKLAEKLAERTQDPQAARRWRMSRVHVLQSARRKDDAVKAAAQLYDDAPDSPVLTMLNVRVLLWVKDYDKALAILDKALRDGIDADLLAELRMQTLAFLGKFDELTKVLNRQLDKVESDEEKSDLWYAAGSIYSLAGKAEESHKALEQSLKLNRNNASACNDLGYQLADIGKDLARAEKLTRTAVEQRPDTSAYLDSLAWVLYKKGQFADAADMLKRVFELEPEPDGVILDHYGDVLWRLGKRDEAVRQWKLAVQSREEDPDRLLGLEQSTLEKMKAKLKAAEQDPASVPVAPLGENVTPPGAQRT